MSETIKTIRAFTLQEKIEYINLKKHYQLMKLKKIWIR